MAEQEKSKGFLHEVGAGLTKMVNAAMEGGEINAAVTQGFKELGNAFGQAFPVSIMVDQPGTVFNPFYQDMVESREPVAGPQIAAPLPSPSAAMESVSAASVVADNLAKQSYVSPSELGNLPSPVTPLEHDRDQGREM